MTVLVSGLVAFLTARLDEREEAARAASPGSWSYGDIESIAGGSLYEQDVMIASLLWDQPREVDPRIRRSILKTEADANGEHIALHDPEWVLRDVDAKRRIIAQCAEILAHFDRTDVWGGWPDIPAKEYAEDTLGLLALPYVDHSDYQEKWKP